MSNFESCTRRDPGTQNDIILNIETITFIERVARDIYKVHFVSGEEITVNYNAAESIAQKVGLKSFR